MFCKNCGAEIDDKAVICVKCGCATGNANASQINSVSETVSPKSRLVAFILCTFLGMLGVHRFYLGRVGSGIAMIFTFGGLGLWVLIDWIVLLCGSFKDNAGRVVSNWNN